ncbi:MAG TPA: AAA family ATPase [Vicinamibacteria bacterium]|nr:AAA family ATPase [Vicinamibacteria bacterium]
MDSGLRQIVLAWLEADGSMSEGPASLVLGALGGLESLETHLAGGPLAASGADAAAGPPPSGVLLRSITVEGFRGIGGARALEVSPGPGLTLVVGRNGSGKSSFAEALEVLLTGDSLRFKDRAAVWRDGWRNLHHDAASLTATFMVEGEAEPWIVSRRWEQGAAFEQGVVAIASREGSSDDLDSRGWRTALRAYRPFLSYNELGSLLDEGPSKLYDALSSILGLEDLVAAQSALQDARRTRDKAQKEAVEARDRLLEVLRTVEDARSARVAAAIEGKEWDLEEVDRILSPTPRSAAGAGTAEADILRGIASLEPPDAARVAEVAAEMRGAAKALVSARGTTAARSRDAANLLDLALSFHATHGGKDCPVCGREGSLDAAWAKRQRTAVARLREASREAEAVHARADAARRRWEDLTAFGSEALQRAGEVGLDLGELVQALGVWVRAGSITDLEELAGHLESASGPLREAVLNLRQAARAALEKEQDAWRPVAAEIGVWLLGARGAQRRATEIDGLKRAEAWLKKASAGIRDDRFEPIAGKAAGIWEHLRQQSHVDLGRIQLTGDGTRRRVVLDVTVDGVAGAALGVMSQGELHSLALSLFIPRATLPQSPFRFIVIDDPVQSMDPARVDGLARVLEAASKDRQVIVFTHDDRLPEAVRRLDIAVDILEVTRREGSVVELRRALDPVGRYLEDAIEVASTAALPASPAAEVVPGLCRLALEAVCMEVVRARRLMRGEAHSAVERVLGDAQSLARLAALALFDDAARGSEVFDRLKREASAPFAEAFRQAEAGENVSPADAIDLARRTSNLAAWLRGLR